MPYSDSSWVDPTRKITTILIIKGKWQENWCYSLLHTVWLSGGKSNNDSTGMGKFCKYGILEWKNVFPSDRFVTFFIITEIDYYPSYVIFNNHIVKLCLLLSLERTLEQANYLGAMVMSINKSMGNCWGQTLRYVLIAVVSATPDICSISPFQRAHSTFWCPSWLTGGKDFSVTVGSWILLAKDL